MTEAFEPARRIYTHTHRFHIRTAYLQDRTQFLLFKHGVFKVDGDLLRLCEHVVRLLVASLRMLWSPRDNLSAQRLKHLVIAAVERRASKVVHSNGVG